MEKDRLMKLVEEYVMNNIMFQSFASQEEYPRLVKVTDMGVLFFSGMNKTPVIPGKLIGYMAA